MKRGSDYSKYNGKKPIRHTDEFVILRAGYGRNNIDREFVSNVNRCKELGVPYGVYWFSYALNSEMASKEADYCIDLIDSLSYKPLYPIYYDNEYDTNNYFRRKLGRTYTKFEFNSMVQSFCQRAEELGYYAGVYINKDYYKNYLDADNKERYTLWLADYECGGRDNSFKGKFKNVHTIQYTNVPWDKDICRVDFPSVIRRAHLNGY